MDDPTGPDDLAREALAVLLVCAPDDLLPADALADALVLVEHDPLLRQAIEAELRRRRGGD